MSDSDTTPTTSARPMGARPTTTRGASSIAQLETDRGTTSIADSVVMKIAGIAAREIDAVAELGGSFAGALGNVVGRIRGSEHKTTGVDAEVGAREAAIDLTIKVHYPASIHEVAESVRQNVIDRIETMTGLRVVEVNIDVVDLAFPGSEDSGEQQPPPPPPAPPRVQ